MSEARLANLAPIFHSIENLAPLILEGSSDKVSRACSVIAQSLRLIFIQKVEDSLDELKAVE